MNPYLDTSTQSIQQNVFNGLRDESNFENNYLCIKKQGLKDMEFCF